LTPTLALLPLLTYGIYAFLHYQDASEHVADDSLDVRPAREWATLVVALLVIAVGVEGIVRAALSLGAIFGTPSVLWGVTVIAAGTSLPDAYVSVRAAQNDDVTSLTNVLESNTFNLLVAIPLGVLLAGSATIHFLAAVPTMGFLAVATLVCIVFTRTRLELTDREAYGFLGLYGLFLLWMVLDSGHHRYRPGYLIGMQN